MVGGIDLTGILFFISFFLFYLSYSVVSNYSVSIDPQTTVQHYISGEFLNDNFPELIKAELSNLIYQNHYSTAAFLKDVDCTLHSGTNCAPSSVLLWQSQLLTQQDVRGIPANLFTRKLIGVSSPDSSNLYADFEIQQTQNALPVGTEKKPGIRSRTIRLDLGQATKFNSAVTMDRVDCLFCHGVFYGNVTQYYDAKAVPYTHTQIHGSYISGEAIANGGTNTDQFIYIGTSANMPLNIDWTNTNKIIADYVDYNGSPDIGSYAKNIFQYYSGPLLPWNTPRKTRMLPKFNPYSSTLTARGNIKASAGGHIKKYPLKNGISSSDCSSGSNSEISGIVECNVIINGGTDITKPTIINGNIFVRGDVVIFGYITGNGTIYSGRNVYIPDNLKYANPSPLFDGSVASNAIMDNVSTNFKSIANQMKGYDRLSLMATNNIVIGDPFPESQNGVIGDGTLGSDYNYLFQTVLSSGYPMIARETNTGFILDESTPDPLTGNPCYVYPWGSSTDCIPLSNVTVENMINPSMYDTWPNYKIEQDRLGVPYPAAYTNTFYPKNSDSSGNMTDWISPNDFITEVRNPIDFPLSTAKDGLGRHNRIKRWSIPILTVNPTDDPYDYSNWLLENPLVNRLENMTGMNLNAHLAENDTIGSGKTLYNRVSEFLTRCLNEYSTRIGENFNCSFSYNETKNRSSAKISGSNAASNPMDVELGAICDDRTNASTPSIPTCTSDQINGNGMTYEEYKDSDFGIHLIYYSGMTSALWYTIETRYWDESKVRPQNKISVIDGHLFANHFISLNSDTDYDRAITFHGGIVTKEMLARFYNNPGNDRAYAVGPNAIPRGVAISDFEVSGSLPSVFIYQDPRVQFETDLLMESYGSKLFEK